MKRKRAQAQRLARARRRSARSTAAESRDSALKLELALKAAKAGTWSFEVADRTSTWDQTFHEQHGFAEADRPSFELYLSRVHPEDRTRLQMAIEQAMHRDGGSNWSDEIRVLHPIKGERWMATLGEIERDAAGNAVRFRGINLDVTERKQSEQRLWETEEWLKLIHDMGGFGIYSFDTRANRYWLSDQAAGLFGLSTQATMTFETIMDLLHPEDRQNLLAAVQRAVDPMGTGEFSAEYRIVRSDNGETRWIMNRAHTAFTGTGTERRPMRGAGVIIDVTDRKRAEALERERSSAELDLWMNTFENAGLALGVSKGSGNTMEWVNPAYARLLGYTVAEMQGIPIPDLFPPEERGRLGELRAAAVRDGSIVFETIYQRKDGSRLPVLIHLTMVLRASGEIAYRVVSALDITERKRTEEALRQAQKMEAIGNLSGGIAHDFNNLLGVILGNLELLRSSLPLGEAYENLDAALDAARRGADLTRRLLALARKQPLRPTTMQLNQRIMELTKLLQSVLGEQIELSLRLDPNLWPVTVDKVQLEASLTNLATNARDAMPSGGRLLITTANRTIGALEASKGEVRPGDYAMIAVADTGTGMGSDVQRRVFEPFFTTKEEGRGSGLGLAMVYAFAKQSGGHISVESTLGVGTTFSLFLPRAQPGAQEPASPRRTAHKRGTNETILVVEDNDELRQVAVRELQALGYRTIEAASGAAALEILGGSHSVQLIFSDIVMRGMDGFTLAREALRRRPGTKILLTSGYPVGAGQGDARLEPVPGPILEKPYDIEALAQAVREVLNA